MGPKRAHVHTDTSVKRQLCACGSRCTHADASCCCIHTSIHTAAVVHTRVHAVADGAGSANPG